MTNSELLLELIGKIDDCYVEEVVSRNKKTSKNRLGVIAAAACIALAFAIPVTLHLLQADAPACPTKVENNPPVPTSGQIDMAAPTSATEGIEQIALIPQYSACGSFETVVALSDAQIVRLQEREDFEVLANCPTLRNLHPSSQDGLLIDVSPETIAQEIAVGQDFLACYYNAEPTDFSFDTMENIAAPVVWYKNDEMDGGVNLDWIQFKLAAPYEGEMTAEAIAVQPIVRAALEWKGIQTIEISEEVNLNVKGDASEYVFTFAKHSDDPVEQLLNFNYRAVTVRIYPEDSLFSISIDYGEPIMEETETAAVTREQLSAFLTKSFPDNPPTEYVVEGFYSPYIEPGKYIPCYRVYLMEPDFPRIAGRTVFSVIEVTTTEIVDSIVIDST